jgi:UDP-GlcNAc:undecaprenyl-phosphate GlcNAc-1-phosphate transferase
MDFSYLIILFLSTLLFVGFFTPVVRNIAISKRVYDFPNSAHKSHLVPIPYLGGIAIIFGVTIVSFTAILIRIPSIENFLLAISIFGPAITLAIVGLVDDLRGLSALSRFMAQTFFGIITTMLIIRADDLGNPTGNSLVDAIITILWIVGICNSINFFDNIDGGATGTSAISSATITYLALLNGQNYIAALSIVLTGGTLGFLIWNKSPARIYMGDAGSLFLGVMLSILTIRLKPDTSAALYSLITPVLILAMPLMDTTIAVFSRLHRGISPFTGGQDHLSHRLIRSGLSRKVTVVILWLLSLFFCLMAILLSAPSIPHQVIVIISVVVWSLLFIWFFTKE